MNKTIKFILFSVAIFIISLIIPNLSNAATLVHDETTLNEAVSSADPGVTITLENDITVTKPIVIAKELTIDGNGHNIVGSNDWTATSGNQSMFTAQFSDAKLTLININLKNGPKYGVQTYDGATVILDKVSISGFRYGGVLVNGGNLEVENLHLGYNGTGANNGIEIDKGAAATNNPILTMNGRLMSDSNENVVRIADNGYLTEFRIENTSTTTNRVVVAGESIALTDANNNIISETVIPNRVTVNADIKTAVVTIVANEKTDKLLVEMGKTVTADLLKSHIQLEADYQIDGYFTDVQYTNEFDFNSPLNGDTTIYAKISKVETNVPAPETEQEKEPETVVKEEKDETPKTGVKSYLGIAVLVLLFLTTAIIFIKKNQMKG